MRDQVPNQLTVLRLALAAVFFLVISQYRYGSGPDWAIWTANAVFCAAAFTDFLDGYLARRWKVESKFGRIMDPFCDKVLILGAYIFLCGPRFVDPERVSASNLQHPGNVLPGNMVSGVYPWMVSLMLARELLVTGLRAEMEGSGRRFGASLWGKIKMVTQSLSVPVVLALIALDPRAPGRQWMGQVVSLVVYATVIVTVISGLPYIGGALRVARAPSIQVKTVVPGTESGPARS
jgi:CDP-diacylglycerol--glycerol-3-phosphate 3-phosphatidyltransferase